MAQASWPVKALQHFVRVCRVESAAITQIMERHPIDPLAEGHRQTVLIPVAANHPAAATEVAVADPTVVEEVAAAATAVAVVVDQPAVAENTSLRPLQILCTGVANRIPCSLPDPSRSVITAKQYLLRGVN